MAQSMCPAAGAVVRDTDGTGGIGRGHTIAISVKQPEVEHTVCMRDFEAWPQSTDRSPAEMAAKSGLGQLLAN
jgi:hypothetical protein